MLLISDSVEDRRRIDRERSIFGVMGGRFGEQWSAKYVATYWKINILNVTYSGKLVEEDREITAQRTVGYLQTLHFIIGQ